MEHFTLTVAGLTRQLPLSFVGRKTKLASFTVLGDVELVDALADTFTAKLKPLTFDYLVALEVKAVPLVHGVAKRLGHKKFVVCRKSIKPYMTSPIVRKPFPTMPKHVKPLVIRGKDAELLKGKRVVIMDDVISTGMTMQVADSLMEDIGATVVAHAAVLRQGEQFRPITNLIALGELPIFRTDSP